MKSRQVIQGKKKIRQRYKQDRHAGKRAEQGISKLVNLAGNKWTVYNSAKMLWGANKWMGREGQLRERVWKGGKGWNEEASISRRKSKTTWWMSWWKHRETLLFVNTHGLHLLADHPHGSCKCSACKCTFLKPGIRVGCILVWTVNLHTLSIDDAIDTPRPLAFNLLTLLNNNNTDGLHACVHAAEDIGAIRFTRTKYNAPLPLRRVKKDYGQPTSHFHHLLVLFSFSFYCLFVYNVQALWACSVLFGWISSATNSPGIWTIACWVVSKRSVWMQIFLNNTKEDRGKKDCISMCGCGHKLRLWTW